MDQVRQQPQRRPQHRLLRSAQRERRDKQQPKHEHADGDGETGV
jgi:hypothetical protein